MRFATSFASKYTDDCVVYPSPEERPSEFVEFLVKFLSNEEIDLLMPIAHESTRLINHHKDRLSEHTIVPVAGAERFDELVRKDAVMRRAERLDVPHPRTAYPDSVDDIREIRSELEFPVVVKPLDSAGSRGLRYVDSPDALADVYESVEASYPGPIIQEQIPLEGRGLGAGFLVWDGEVLAEFAYRRLREYPPSGGPSTLRESIHHDALLEYGRKILLDADWQGVAMVEFKNDPRTDTPNLLEVNPRFWGSLHLPYYAGVDYPALLASVALGETVEPTREYPAGVKCRYLVPGDFLHLFSERDLDAVRDFFPLVDEDLYYDIVDADDTFPLVGRIGAILRYSVDPDIWRRVVFRSSR
ncbi:ATP-grasp domain-containing protein [Haloarcula marina]|uniref:carboxylate--amine ligase n=1 Tax=Haloarcula marina TaxID=2961574 RepID=UPI0020B8AC31|nr:ATP-grasp domain-containing protein [Halomicroarcula marina]